ncbi:N-acetylmuramoyl-L-alanine amidase [Formosa sp. S-31]
MKKLKFKLKNVSFLLMLLNICLVNAQVYPLKKIVVIDPGHGGIDPGALGLHRQEKDITLDIALELKKWNNMFFKNELDLYLTRDSDTLISLADRRKLASALKADAFISIHCNSAHKGARGIEIFTTKKTGQQTTVSQNLAQSILDEFRLQLGFLSRGIKKARYSVLSQSFNQYPAILIETGFISSEDESMYLADKKHIQAVALAILMGIKNHLNLKL